MGIQTGTERSNVLACATVIVVIVIWPICKISYDSHMVCMCVICTDVQSAVASQRQWRPEATKVWRRFEQQAYEGVPATCRGGPEVTQRVGAGVELDQHWSGSNLCGEQCRPRGTATGASFALLGLKGFYPLFPRLILHCGLKKLGYLWKKCISLWDFD